MFMGLKCMKHRELSQLDKFKAAARDAECDIDEATFDKAVGRLAKTDPPTKTEKPETKKPAK